MPLTILGVATDVRTGTSVVYTQMNIPEYLAIVGNDFGNFPLQRRQETHKGYGRLKSDIRDGALLPAITLSVKPESVPTIMPAYDAYRLHPAEGTALAAMLNTPGSVDILDGLQRTYIMRDIADEGSGFKEGQRILVEFWLEPDIHKLIYRIIVLNAGQKPMSIRHQLELLFASLQESIVARVPDIEVYRERDNTRRSRPRKFAFDTVVSAYQAMITESAELQKNNIVANQLMESSALDMSEASLSQQFDTFMALLGTYAGLDEGAFRVYRTPSSDQAEGNPINMDLAGPNDPLPANLINWFATENVMVSFFAAHAQYATNEAKRRRIDDALVRLGAELAGATVGADPLGLIVFNQLRTGVSPRKINVGVATRRLLTNGFKEFFRDAGDTPLADCWTLAAE